MKEITLDEMLADVQAQEALIHEPDEAYMMLTHGMEEVAEAARSGKVAILSDYDADGICSAYIMEKLVKAINPECEVTVSINDRRGSYGLSPDIQGDGESRYIVCDMGSNQLPLARERLGESVIIIDHHLIENDAIAEEFKKDHRLINPHAFHKDDSQNAQYCATGLAYRLFQMAENVQALQETNEKLSNTMAVMACIGTATDMVDVLDINSYNRTILKNGLEAIDKADETNLDFVIGNMLAKQKVNDGITAHQLAFNVGAFLNSASRMSEVIEQNGAALMYDMLTSDATDFKTYRKMEQLMDWNADRKALISQLTSDPEYQQFIEAHRYGEQAQDNIGVYQLPDNVPAAFAGLIAGKLTEATDKAIICLTYSESRGTYTGSGRNAESNETSLMDFMKAALQDSPVEIQYGGHEEALGISRLNDIEGFKKAVDDAKDLMLAKSTDDKTVLKLSAAELSSPDTLQKVLALEPTGIGLQIPSVEIRGVETFREKLFLKDNSQWKTVRIKDTEARGEDGKPIVTDVKDWSYSPESYPQSGKKNNEIALIAELGISDFRGIHLELTTKFDRAFFAERQKEVAEQQKNLKQPTKE